ncbi:MAG: hypothetical protein P9L97_05725 [Candidatus Tenebribacter davisii]|nr:hypothetical protein [Candidatus Tenebribacter davisii]
MNENYPKNPNASQEKIFEQVKKYGPVSPHAIANDLGIDHKRISQAISVMRKKKLINIQKIGTNKTRQYFYDPEWPVLGSPSLKIQAEEKEEDEAFNSLLGTIDPNEKGEMYYSPKKLKKGLDLLVNRCHHLILALENCSSMAIMENFNLDEEQARVLVNKVMAKYANLNLSFCVHVNKEKNGIH